MKMFYLKSFHMLCFVLFYIQLINAQTFTKITQGDIVNDGGSSKSVSWVDYDADGDLDLYVTNVYNENNFLYSNNANGTFTKISDNNDVND